MRIFTFRPMHQAYHRASHIRKMPQVFHGHFPRRYTATNIPQCGLNLRRIGAMGRGSQSNSGRDFVVGEDAFNSGFTTVMAGLLAYIWESQ
jgi:hypothetical protein